MIGGCALRTCANARFLFCGTNLRLDGNPYTVRCGSISSEVHSRMTATSAYTLNGGFCGLPHLNVTCDMCLISATSKRGCDSRRPNNSNGTVVPPGPPGCGFPIECPEFRFYTPRAQFNNFIGCLVSVPFYLCWTIVSS